jgi:hypothetical protein
MDDGGRHSARREAADGNLLERAAVAGDFFLRSLAVAGIPSYGRSATKMVIGDPKNVYKDQGRTGWRENEGSFWKPHS